MLKKENILLNGHYTPNFKVNFKTDESKLVSFQRGLQSSREFYSFRAIGFSNIKICQWSSVVTIQLFFGWF